MAECANEVPLHERHDLIDENADFSRLLKHIAELEQENSELRKKASQVEFFEGEAKRHKHSVVGLRNLFKRFLFLTYIRDFKMKNQLSGVLRKLSGALATLSRSCETGEGTSSFGVPHIQQWVREARTLQLQRWLCSEDARLREENTASHSISSRASQSAYLSRRRQQEERQRNRKQNEMKELGFEHDIAKIIATDVRLNGRGKVKRKGGEATSRVLSAKTKSFAEAVSTGADLLEEGVLSCVAKIKSLENIARSFHNRQTELIAMNQTAAESRKCQEEEIKVQVGDSLASNGRRSDNVVQTCGRGGRNGSFRSTRPSSARSHPRSYVRRPVSGRGRKRDKRRQASAVAWNGPSKRKQVSKLSNPSNPPESFVKQKRPPEALPSELPNLAGLNLSSLPPLPPRLSVSFDTTSTATSDSEVTRIGESGAGSEDPEPSDDWTASTPSAPPSLEATILSGVFTPLWSHQRPRSAGLRPKKPINDRQTNFYSSANASQASNFRSNYGLASSRNNAFSNFRHFQPRPRSARTGHEEIFVIRNGRAGNSK